MYKSLIKLSTILAFTITINSPALADTTLHVTAAPAGWAPMFQKIVSAFEAKHPDIHIDIQANVRNFESLTDQTLREAVVGNLPDVTITGSNQIRPFVERHLAVDLASFIASDSKWAEINYSATAADTGKFDGHQYGLTLAASLPVIIYNKGLVTQAGGDAENFPSNWPEIIALGKKINAIDNATQGLFFEHDSSGNWTFQSLVDAEGGRMGTESGKISFDDDHGLAALKTIRKIGQAGQANADMTRNQARQAFSAGKLGALMTASSVLGKFKKQVGNNFAIGVAPIPVSDNNGRVPAAGLSAIIFSKDEQKAEASWAFLRFLMSPKSQEIIVKATGMVPFNEKVITEQKYLGKFYAENPLFVTAMESRNKMTNWYSFPGPNSTKIYSNIKDILQKVITLKMEPKEALVRMQKEVSSLL